MYSTYTLVVLGPAGPCSGRFYFGVAKTRVRVTPRVRIRVRVRMGVRVRVRVRVAVRIG